MDGVDYCGFQTRKAEIIFAAVNLGSGELIFGGVAVNADSVKVDTAGVGQTHRSCGFGYGSFAR